MVLENGRPGESYCIGGYGEKTNIDLVRQICTSLNYLKPTNKWLSKINKVC